MSLSTNSMDEIIRERLAEYVRDNLEEAQRTYLNNIDISEFISTFAFEETVGGCMEAYITNYIDENLEEIVDELM